MKIYRQPNFQTIFGDINVKLIYKTYLLYIYYYNLIIDVGKNYVKQHADEYYMVLKTGKFDYKKYKNDEQYRK